MLAGWYSAIPFRYRGYVYDQETGFYYLNSRYYDPSMHRFINADGLVSTGQGLLGNNMYAYCNNNPVMYVDPNGNRIDAKEVLTFWTAFGQLIAWADGLFLVGDAIYVAGIVALTAVVLTVPSSEAQDKIESIPNVETEADRKNGAIYYGAKIENGKLIFLTGPMNEERALLWLDLRSDNQGKTSNWGLYTYDQLDAFYMAFILSPTGLPISSCVEKQISGNYPHYHVNIRDYINKGKTFTHFHIWYGEPIL